MSFIIKDFSKDGVPCYLESLVYPTREHGNTIRWTDDPKKAHQFPTLAEAMKARDWLRDYFEYYFENENDNPLRILDLDKPKKGKSA